MSEKQLIINEDEKVELALSLRQLIDESRLALPAPKPEVTLALPGKAVFHKMIASKITNGYQVEFIMPGEVIYGFVIGLDDFVVQVYDVGYGSDFQEMGDYPIEEYAVKSGIVRHWLPLHSIEACHENFFGVKHLVKSAQEDLNRERRAMVNIAERYLKNNSYSRGR